MDPISLTVGGAIMLVGYALGKINRTKRSAEATRQAMCVGCEHSITFRDPDTGRCTAQIKKSSRWEDGIVVDYAWSQCTCQNHVTAEQMLITGTDWGGPKALPNNDG